MKLVTHDTFVTRLDAFLANPHMGEVIWKGKTLVDASFDEIKGIALELLEDSEAVLHIRKPGPKTVHYVGRPDIKANGKECIEVCS
jgi:hypothetical protein|tara:strand:+ start:380 stop:637 length:258 start_codon:yes stop_codon:yes gene_type:complete